MSIGKNNKGWRKIIFLKRRCLIGFVGHLNVVHGSTKLFIADHLSKRFHEKVIFY